MAKKIYLSPSDQTSNKYAYGGHNEETICEKIADACEAALKRCGFDVKNNKTSSMADRVKESDKWGADLHVPIHTNAYNNKVTGTRMFSWDTSGAGYKACKAIFDVLAPMTPGTSENIRANKTLYEIRKPKAPSAYIEVDFHDVYSVAKWLVEHTAEIGETIARGICNYYGVKYEAPQPAAKVLYKVQVGAYGEKANAESMMAKLEKAGFKGIIVEVKQ